MPPSPVVWHVQAHVATVTIDAPPLNLLTAAVRQGLGDAVDDLAARAPREVRAVVITGAGEKAFCAGADLKEEYSLTEATVPAFLDSLARVFDGLSRLPCPVVAAVQGAAMGGGFELALAADIRIAALDAQFAASSCKVGVLVSAARLTRLLGEAIAKDLLFTGRAVGGEEAVALGLASRAVPAAAVLGEAWRWAELIASRAPLAVAGAKEMLTRGLDMTLAEGLAAEHRWFCNLQASGDHRHALEAFFHKRQPLFRGE